MVTDGGISRLANELQFLKAPFPILVTDDGIVRFANELHPSKARFPMLVAVSGKTMLVNLLQFWKMLSASLVSRVGMLMVSNAVQLQKAQLPTWLIVLGRVTCFNLVQPKKEFVPIEITESGMVMLTNEVHPWKALPSIVVVPGGISTWPSEDGRLEHVPSWGPKTSFSVVELELFESAWQPDKKSTAATPRSSAQSFIIVPPLPFQRSTKTGWQFDGKGRYIFVVVVKGKKKVQLSQAAVAGVF